MTEIPSKWILKKYASLWHNFKQKEFKGKEAQSVMKGVSNPSNFYSELKKAGWLTMRLDVKDSRKHIYQLKDPKEVIEEIGKNG